MAMCIHACTYTRAEQRSLTAICMRAVRAALLWYEYFKVEVDVATHYLASIFMIRSEQDVATLTVTNPLTFLPECVPYVECHCERPWLISIFCFCFVVTLNDSCSH